MVVRNFLEVHVDDLAALEVLMVEMHDAEFRGRDVLQEFLLLDLGILTVTLGLVLDDFHVLCLHFCHALGTKNDHQAVVVAVRVEVGVLLFLLFLLLPRALIGFLIGLVLSLHFLHFHLCGLLHDHFSIDALE